MTHRTLVLYAMISNILLLDCCTATYTLAATGTSTPLPPHNEVRLCSEESFIQTCQTNETSLQWIFRIPYIYPDLHQRVTYQGNQNRTIPLDSTIYAHLFQLSEPGVLPLITQLLIEDEGNRYMLSGTTITCTGYNPENSEIQTTIFYQYGGTLHMIDTRMPACTVYSTFYCN